MKQQCSVALKKKTVVLYRWQQCAISALEQLTHTAEFFFSLFLSSYYVLMLCVRDTVFFNTEKQARDCAYFIETEAEFLQEIFG
jgi:hypothetical protein